MVTENFWIAEMQLVSEIMQQVQVPRESLLESKCSAT